MPSNNHTPSTLQAVYVKYPDGLQRERECDDQSFYFRNGRVGAFSG